MDRFVWFELVDRGKKALANTDGVLLPANALVIQLRKTLVNPQKYRSKHLNGIDEADLRVYDMSGQLLDEDMTIGLNGDAKIRPLVVEVPKLWYQLFAAGISITGPTSAPLSDSSSVEDLRNVVEATYGEIHMRGIAASDLKVYTNIDVYGKKQDSMKASSKLVGCGVDEDHPLVVVVPKLWYQLFAAGVSISSTASAPLSDSSSVADLRNVVEATYGETHLRGIAAEDLKVYADLDSCGKEEGPMKPSSKLVDCGVDEDHPLVVVVPKLFYQLFTAGVSITGPTSAPLSDSSSVEDLRNVVEATYGETHLRGIAAEDLKVYADLDSCGKKQDSMKASSKLVDCGVDEDHPLVVVVPKLFYQLFTAGVSITGPTSAPLSDSSSVEDLQKVVEATYGETYLRGIAASDLKVYSNLDAYGKEDPMEFTRALVGCGVDGNCFIVVEVPSKRQKTVWTTSSFDLTASTVPSLDDFQQPIWKFNVDLISGFKVEYSSDKLILSCREDVNDLFWFLRDGVLRDGQCGFVLGPPGSGKSAACAAFALALMRTDWVVTWMHIGHKLSLAFVRLEGDRKKTAILQKTGLTMNDLKQILYEVQGKHFVFLDGVTGDDNKEEILCNEWFLEDRENRRLVLVSSMASRRKAKMDEDTELNLQEHFVSSWTLDEYFKAVKDNELFHAVEPRLDASNELDPVVVVVSNDDTVSHINGEMVLRQEHVKSKYYFAGGSVRFMFGYTTARVVAELDKAVKALPNATADATGIVGDRSADVINRLYCGFRGTSNRQGIISRYAGSAIARFGGPTLIKNFASVLKEDSNAAMDGWMLEMYFFARIRRGGVTLYDGANEIHWPEDTIHTFNPLDITKLPVAGWLKPLKYNQGGYDAVYIDQDQGLVRFVQVTLAHKHSFRIRYFSEFFELLSKSSSSFEVETLEIFFVIDQRVLKDFKIDVTGEGLLAAFPGWGKYKEKGKVRRVGIQGVDSWEDFDW